jgi:hypothetical protein
LRETDNFCFSLNLRLNMEDLWQAKNR